MTAAARQARHREAAEHVAAVHAQVLRDWQGEDDDVVDDLADVARPVPEQRTAVRPVPSGLGPDGARLALLERGREWAAAEQAVLAVRLRRAGATWDAIGSCLGIGGRAASLRYGGGC